MPGIHVPPFLVALALSPLALAQGTPSDGVSTHSVPASSGETLVIDLQGGGTLDIRGWGEPRVLVTAKLGGRDGGETRVSLARNRGGSRLRSFLPGSRDNLSTSNAYEVRVPRRHDVEIRSEGGDIRIADVEGRFQGSTRGGSIVLERLRGVARLSTRGGNVEISDSHLEGLVTTRGGATQLSRVTGGIQASLRVDDDEEEAVAKSKPAGSKHKHEVEVRHAVLESGAEGARTIDLPGGPIQIDAAPHGAVLHTGGGPIAVLRSGGAIDATTGAGDVEIGPTSGPVSVSTGAGDIRVTIARNLRSDESVELSSGLGVVTLELPPQFDGALDLRTGYTERFGRATRIRSDWELKVDHSDWIQNGGTPQRYVHGTATGRGPGRVIVRTTNGDIVVRRSRGN